MPANLPEDQGPPAGGAEPVRPEDLLEREDGARYELIDGRLVERHMGARSSEVAANIIRVIGQYVVENKLGKVFAPDCGYQIFADDPNGVRFPAVSFIARGHLPEDKAPDGHVLIPPDLAVEVVSPHDSAEQVEAKRVAFLRAGTRLFWVVYPDSRTVHVYRQGKHHALALAEGDELSGEEVLTGFLCRVAAFFEEG
jgi:Uma2 family endonuclease